MYKSSQNNLDMRARVGSHATKGHPARGVLSPRTTAQEQIVTERQLTLAEKKARRAELIAMLESVKGNARQGIQGRIVALTAEIKHENMLVSDALQARLLWQAMKDVLPPELFRAVSDRKTELERAAEGHA